MKEKTPTLVILGGYGKLGCAVAGFLQYFDGVGTEPGLHFMGHEVDPDRFLKDMERMGVCVDKGGGT